MLKAASVTFALLAVPLAAACASAQAPGPGASPSAATTPPPSGHNRRPAVYTGLDIRFSASVGADGVLVQNYPVVLAVEPESPGQQAGVVAGDAIIEVNGRDSREDRVLWLEPGVRYTVRLRTGDQEREVVLLPLPPRTPAS